MKTEGNPYEFETDFLQDGASQRIATFVPVKKNKSTFYPLPKLNFEPFKNKHKDDLNKKVYLKKVTSSDEEDEDEDCVNCVSLKLMLNKKDDQLITMKDKYRASRNKLKRFNKKMQEIKRKIEEMRNDPSTLTFDTSVGSDLTISEEDMSEEEQVLDLASFREPTLFQFEKQTGKH